MEYYKNKNTVNEIVRFNRFSTHLLSVTELKESGYIDRNIEDTILAQALMYVQDHIVENILGTSLFSTLLLLTENCEIDLPENECYKTLVDTYLKQAVIHSVIAELQVPLSFKTRQAGTTRVTDENMSSASLNEIKYIENHYRNRADYYMLRLRDYLRCNTCRFPELKECAANGEVKASDVLATNFCLKKTTHKERRY